MVAFIEARNVLQERLQRVFSEEVFSQLFPGIQIPKVFFGFPKTEPPFYVAVDEIVDSLETGRGATSGHAEITFPLHVWAFAQHSSLRVASDTLLTYLHTIIYSVLADPQLDFTVDNSTLTIDNAGTATDSSKYYQAAASVAVQCTVYSVCPAELNNAIRKNAIRKESNGD